MTLEQLTSRNGRTVLITTVGSIIVATIGASATAHATAPAAGLSGPEVREIVRTESPYVADRELLRSSLERHERLLLKIDGDLRKIEVRNVEDRVILRQLLRRSSR